LSLAFFLISVLPLALVTAYSYYSSAAALRRAVEGQAGQMAAEMGDRMTWVMADLGDRVERLWRMRVEDPGADRAAGEPEPGGADTATATLQNVAATMLAEAAPLVQRLEFTSMPADEPPAPSMPPQPSAPPDPPLARVAPGAPRAGSPMAFSRADGSGAAGRREPGTRGTGPRPPGSGPFGPGSRTAPRGAPVLAPGMPRVVIEMLSPPVRTATGQTHASFEALTPDAINAWRRAIQRQVEREAQLRGQSAGGMPPGLVPTGPFVRGRRESMPRVGPRAAPPGGSRTNPPETPPGTAPGPVPGVAAGVSEAAQQAEHERRLMERQQRMTALARGQALQFTVRREGQVIGEINATVDRQRMIETVLSLGRRDRGEIPFVLDAEGHVHTVDPAAGETIKALNLDATARAAKASSTTTLSGDWLVVTRRDASGIVFGLARPMRDTLRDMRRTSLGNLALGLLLIAASFAVILPLASRLTRHITALTDGVQRLAHGDRRTRVEVDTSDEVGELARSFNRMASELESHEQMLVKQERLARELELCRQIQNDMLPHGPLKIGLAEIAGVSIPAREVGGDFFNYFPLHDGRIALLVGDVSGKGVGAALLMANIQATLRARLQLESDLARLADEVDHDVEANTPPEVYITLFVAILDPPRRELRYVNAGHNPQFLLRANGGIERLESTGLPVGLLPGRGFEERAVQVDPGDLLFLYTDGAVEAPNEAGDMFDADRLQQALVAASAAGIDEVLVSVEQAIRNFRGNAEPADDATMMALRLGKPQPA
jgi:serine phosphatase RsbU (regulator of sigma subunit)